MPRFKLNTKERVTALLFIIFIFIMPFGMLLFHAEDLGGEFIRVYHERVPTGAAALSRVKGAIGALNSAVNEAVPCRTQFVELYGLAQLVMDKKIVTDPNYGALYKTPYGQITYAVEKMYMGTNLEHTYELVNRLLQKKIPFLYVQAPFKLPDAHSQVPLTVTDYANENADEFLAGLIGAKVSCMDLRPLLASSGLSQKELFYDTDHHWTVDAAFFSAGQIAKKLNEDYGFKIDEAYFNMDNYDRKRYEKFYIGSLGRRVGRIYGGIDDFTLITPKFETNLTLTENGGKLQTGSFEDAVLNKAYIDEKAPLDTNRYAVYHGDMAELIFENHMALDGKILIIKDSFGIPVYSFLALGAREVRAIDVRLFTRDVADYAIEYNPDVVIVLYNADCFRGQMFDFKEKEGE